jgi:hypothetical protein
MIDTTAADAFAALLSAEREQLVVWVSQLDLVHATAIHGLVTVRLVELGVVSISGTVDFG